MTKAQAIQSAVAAATPTLRQEALDEIIDKVLGIEVESPFKINGKAVDNRERLARYLAGDTTVKMTPEMLRLFTFLFAFRHGKPGQRRLKDSGKKSLVFVSHPWMHDPMAEQEAAAIAGQKAQEKIEAAAAERKRQGMAEDPVDDEDPDTPVLVR